MTFRKLSVPRRIEELLRRAAADAGFRSLFLLDPVAAAASANVELSTAERAVIGALPPDQLDRLIDRVVAA